MSIETDFRGTLATYLPLTALVADRIAQDAVPEGAAGPLVVFAVRRQPLQALDGAVLANACTFDVQCWAATAALAAQVADAVVAAVATAPATVGAGIEQRATTHDPELGLDGVQLSVTWWGS